MTYPTREDVVKPRKRAKSTQQAAKNKADIIFSKIVRNVGRCENCGTSYTLQCAHYLSRRYSNIRTDFDNAFCLCARCHAYFSADPTAWADWALERRGRATYDRLREAANRHSEVDWPAFKCSARQCTGANGEPWISWQANYFDDFDDLIVDRGTGEIVPPIARDDYGPEEAPF